MNDKEGEVLALEAQSYMEQLREGMCMTLCVFVCVFFF
jgi:hypothetical protein